MVAEPYSGVNDHPVATRLFPLKAEHPPTALRAMPAVARLPLPEALEACLGLLDASPSRYERAALAWHARLIGFAPQLRFTQANTVLNALAALPTPSADRAAFRLARVCAAAGLDEVVAVLERWSQER